MLNIIESASIILSKLMSEEYDFSIFSDESLAKIDMNLEDDVLKKYKLTIIDAARLLKKTCTNEYEFASDKTVEVIYALLKFLADPNRYIMNSTDESEINALDPTNKGLKEEIVKLSLSYISKELLEFNSNQHHLEIKQACSNDLLY